MAVFVWLTCSDDSLSCEDSYSLFFSRKLLTSSTKSGDLKKTQMIKSFKRNRTSEICIAIRRGGGSTQMIYFIKSSNTAGVQILK